MFNTVNFVGGEYSILDTGRRKKESEEFYWYAIENMVRIKHPEEPNLHRES